MTDLFAYMEYREYLKDFYAWRKGEKATFSLRYIGQKVGMDDSYVSKVLMGERHLPIAKIHDFTNLCSLKGRHAQYFEALVLFGRAKTDEERKPFLDKLVRLRAVKGHSLEAHQQKFYSKAYYTAIRALMSLSDWRDEYDEIGRRVDPPLRGSVVRDAIEFLLQIGLIHRNESGILEPTEHHIRSGKPFDRAAVKVFQQEMLELAKRSLSVHSVDSRDFSTLTVAVKKETIADIRSLVAECRDAIRKRIEQDEDPDTVFQINVQVFPLSKAG